MFATTFVCSGFLSESIRKFLYASTFDKKAKFLKWEIKLSLIDFLVEPYKIKEIIWKSQIADSSHFEGGEFRTELVCFLLHH